MTINADAKRYLIVFKRKSVFLLLLVFAFTKAAAQYDVSLSHYWDLEPSFNPAAVGKEAKLNVVGTYHIDFAGFEHNPQVAYIGADMPFYFARSYHGVGLSMINDKIGLFRHQRIGAQYAFRKKLLGGQLSVGLQAALLLETFKGSEIDVDASEDVDPVLIKSDVSGNSFDLGAGIYYQRGRWYVGASAQHLTAPTVHLGETNDLKIKRTYYLTGGYNIKLRNPFLSIPTSVLARYDGTAYRADITARLVYTHEKKRLYIGVGYSPTNSVTAYIGGSFHGVQLGYSYEMYTTGVGIGHGSHGLVVKYQTDINLQKRGRNKHKSVRFL